ncbi:MAG: phosphoenolpyruvate hydrolase family protein [Chloroflexota bacterium]
MTVPRREILRRLHVQIAAGKPIIGAGASTGIAARSEEAGGADLLIIYNSGRFRRAGFTSLAGLFAYGDANAIVLDLAAEILPVVQHTPVLAGVNATDPLRPMPAFLRQLQQIGFSGVHNFPTVGLFEGVLRANMEATGLGYDREVAMIAAAHQMELFTSAYAFTPAEACAMAEAGADLIVPHVGPTVTGADAGIVTPTFDQAIAQVMALADAARRARPDVLVACHGGPFDEPERVGQALARMPGICGFYGASHLERLPAERAITAQTEAFKAFRLADPP